MNLAGWFETTNEYWDCNCGGGPGEYIHRAEEEACTVCGAHRDEQPDSRVGDVGKYGQSLLQFKEEQS